MLLIAAIGIPSAGQKVGYVYCSSRDNPLPSVVYSSPPMSLPVATLNCGDKVQVLGRRESWVRIASGRYVAMTTISERKDRYVALTMPLPPEPRPQLPDGTVLPRPIYTPNAEYTQEAQKAGIHGEVIVKATIGADGKVNDVTVLNGLGYGLDESAAKAVQSWRFEPSLKGGTPTDFKTALEVDFPRGN